MPGPKGIREHPLIGAGCHAGTKGGAKAHANGSPIAGRQVGDIPGELQLGGVDCTTCVRGHNIAGPYKVGHAIIKSLVGHDRIGHRLEGLVASGRVAITTSIPSSTSPAAA